ncbi:hypothetical protein HKBW3S43_01746 [Candidatus Hakubella thermalkaliphila]|uniref:Uncharacterized protein n=1 Tax=Candidatus Hakubella thermalkaliphila TaxID=2754717 RepID=A0A6V8P4E3_9ACTN|nr:hypothetical protein HKBW3S06_00809 [Candidatus Hakubella thermalkaliphila]GFP24966.1 hypothetical protein HKBW3S25_00404 [Candidatus Hakubella thermalkaliphila]GFP27472.1 hypothetical protein HKBW3S33_00885 [Candidatus Hakubella thermalkaliphila]GFP35958.1 hypothetical protein HKBW3S43_01746 [Candidatus Hakubella thermalkaliphila]GFP42095.1 hypothetical protein HKBW3C_01221 [Candidatus Hakubella thermalkaliphila]
MFVYTREEFEYLKSIGFSLVNEIVKRGKVLYEAGDKGMDKDDQGMFPSTSSSISLKRTLRNRYENSCPGY